MRACAFEVFGRKTDRQPEHGFFGIGWTMPARTTWSSVAELLRRTECAICNFAALAAGSAPDDGTGAADQAVDDGFVKRAQDELATHAEFCKSDDEHVASASPWSVGRGLLYTDDDTALQR